MTTFAMTPKAAALVIGAWVAVLGMAPVRGEIWITNGPLADTYLEPYGSESKNFGGEPVLRADQWGGRQVLLRFALSKEKEKRLLDATVRLFITETGLNEAGELSGLKTGLILHDLVTPWTETGATFNTADGTKAWNQGPGIGGGKYGDVGPLPPADIGAQFRRQYFFDPEALAKGRWVELDVTRFVRDNQRSGASELNLILRSGTLGRNYHFRSQEATVSAERPQLVLRYSESVPDYRIQPLFITDWKAGTPVVVKLSRVLSGSPRWTVEGPDGAPVLIPGKQDAASLIFVPPGPGRYRVRCSVPASTAGTVAAEEADIFVLGVRPHPRLYVPAKGLAALREVASANGRIFKAYKVWVENGNRGVAQGKYHDMGAKEGCEDNAFMYLLTGEPIYASNSMAYAEVMLARPLREHFRDVHEVTYVGASWAHAMAVHYDACHDRLTPEQRARAGAWLKEAARWCLRRSPAPMAHNDGGARQVMLASAPAALLGDDPEAPELWQASHENFETHLLPWLNDGGRGGRSGDGGEYEGLHAFYIVRYAWMAQSATGDDVFTQSPFFENRLQHVLFGWYPRKLWERRGGYAMRQYYSPSGDHIRMGYVGDTQPYQSAAALCARFRDLPTAAGVRWMVGDDWPVNWMQYTLKWAVLGDFERLPAATPVALDYFDRGMNTMYARGDWSDDATWVLFENSPLVSAHGSLDSGTFEIFKGDLLAARTGNLDHANVGASHSMNYLHRTIAANSLLIHDPEEKWRGFLGGASGVDDGGGQRTNWPLTTSPEVETYLQYRPIFQRGQLLRTRSHSLATYAFADLTPAYTHAAFHNGNLNRAKVERVTRQLIYLRPLDAVLVFDRVHSVQPAFKKTWLLHSLGDLEVLDGAAEKVDDGEWRYQGATRAVIRHGWEKPKPSFGRCLSVTLLPEGASVRKIGGRVDLGEGETATWPGDQWHQKHRHRHLKDFWVQGTNYPPGNPPEVRWFGDPGSKDFVPGTPDETGGRGKWRIEVSPSRESARDLFFHVLCPRLGRDGGFPEVRALAAESFKGALISESRKSAAVFFGSEEKNLDEFRADLPQGTRVLIVADLARGTYETAGAASVVVGEDGLLILENPPAQVRLQRR